jgi:hypothetical protein
MYPQEGRLGSPMDFRQELHLCQPSRRFRRYRGYLLQWFIRFHLLAEEAWSHARSYLLQRAHLS